MQYEKISRLWDRMLALASVILCSNTLDEYSSKLVIKQCFLKVA